MKATERQRAALAFALIADMAGDGCSTKASIRERALIHMRELSREVDTATEEQTVQPPQMPVELTTSSC